MFKSTRNGSGLRTLAVCLLGILWASAAQSDLISSHHFVWQDPASQGMIEVMEEVYDNYGGDYSLYEWKYTIYNIDYDPTPGISNGLSGFNLGFIQPIPELANQYGPAGWFFNCCTGGPPFNAEWDIDNSAGLGILPGMMDMFGFTTSPRYDVIVPAGSGIAWMHSWEFDSQVNTFSGDISGPGAIVPEPGTMMLLGAGFLGLLGYSRWRRKT